MNAKHIMRLGAMLLVLLLAVPFASAATWYIDGTNGDDNFGNGTLSNPYRSITKGIAVAATGDVLSIAAGIYDNAAVNHSGDVGTITVTGTKSLTFVSTTVGADNTAILTNGLNMNSSGTLSIGEGASQLFNLGNTATALTVTQGAITLATAKVVIGNGGTLTIVDGSLSAPPTITSNLNVSYTGTTAVSSATHFPASIGAGTLLINTTSTVTVPQALQCGLINVVAGNATFSADVTASLGIALAGTGAVSFAGVTSVANFVNACTGGVTIAGNLVLGAAAVKDDDPAATTKTNAVTSDFINAAASGTVTIGTSAGNTVTLYTDADVAGAGVTGSLINAAAGTLTVNSSVVLNIKNNDALAVVNFSANPNIDNQGTGTMTIAGTVTAVNANFFTSANGNNNPLTIAINNAGSLTIGQIITPSGAAGTSAIVNVNVVNAGTMATRGAGLRAGTITSTAGTLTLGQAGDGVTNTGLVNVTGGTLNMAANCTFGGALTAAAGTTVNVTNSGSSVAGIVTNAGKIVLGSNSLELKGTGAGILNNTGDIYSTATAQVGTGTLKFTGTAPTIIGGGNLPALQFECATAPEITSGGSVYGVITKNAAGTLTINGATIARSDIEFNAGNIALVGAGLQVNGAFNMNSAAGDFSFGANTLDLKGDFHRIGGTIGVADAGTGTLSFTGSNVQTFDPGVQMTAYNVVVNNSGIGVLNQDIITQSGSLIVLNNYTITAGKVNLGLTNIRMAEAAGSAIFTNGGRGYTATGVGGIIFQGAGANSQMAGINPYSNVYVRLSVNTNNVQCAAAVVVSGILSLEGGGIAWHTVAFPAGTLTLSDVLTTPGYPTVVVRTDNSFADALMLDVAVPGTVPAITTKYNLTYIGPTSIATTGEWVAASINNLSILVDDAVTVTGPAVPSTITGVLTIAGGATGGATFNANAQVVTASGSVTHSVAGSFTNGIFAVSGAAAGVTGSTGVSPIDAASVAALNVTGASFTSTNLKIITLLTYNNATGSASVTMNTASATVTNVWLNAGTMALNMNATASAQLGNLIVNAGTLTYTRNGGAAGTRTIAGTVTLTGGTLVLGSNVDVTVALDQAAGVLNLQGNNLALVGTYTRSGAGTITGSGKFVAAPTAVGVAYTLNAGSKMPNFELNASAAPNGIQLIGAGLEITGAFTHTLGDLNLNALNLTISGGTYNYVAGTYSGTGAIIITGTVVNLSGSPILPNLTINSAATGGTVTLVSTSTASPQVAYTITVKGTLTHTAGAINLGINSIAISDNGAVNGVYTRGAAGTGTFTQGVSGALIFNGTQVGVNTLTQGLAGLVIPNLTVTKATTLGSATTVTVANALILNDILTITADGRLILGDGATVTRTTAAVVLDKVPAIGPTVNNVYSTAAGITTGKELTTSTTALINLTINSTTTLNAPTTVNGKLTLAAAFTTTSPNVITMGPTATLVKQAGGSISTPVTATTLKLEYNGNAVATDNNTWPATATVTSVNFTGAGTKTLHAARTIQGTLTLTAGTLDLAGVNLTLEGDVTFVHNGGGLINSALTVSELILSGSAAQKITLDGNYNMPANVSLRLAKAPATAVATIAGGDLNLNANTEILYLDSGVLSTIDGANSVRLILAHPTTTTIYFTRTSGVVYGRVAYGVVVGDGAIGTNGTFDYPVGTLDGKYRPATIAFTTNYVALTPTALEASMVDLSPGGVKGLPVVESPTVKIGGYPNFFWRFATSPTSMLATQQFDVILQSAANIGYSYDRAENLRILRRQDGDAESNAWAIQGTAASYAAGNYIQVLNGDSILFVRSSSASGGIVAQGTLFTIGVPTRKPAFTTAYAADTVAQIETLTLDYFANAQNIGDSVVFSLVNPPTGATLSATTQLGNGNAKATLTYTPTFATAPGLVTITVRASNGQTVDTTLTVLVTKSPSKPVFTAALGATTLKDGQAFSFTYTASVPAGDTVVFSLRQGPTGATLNTSTGAFNWTPGFYQAGKSYTVAVRAANKSDLTLFVDTTATITVNHKNAKGDVNGNGTITGTDASIILRAVVGLGSVGDSAAVWAADVSGDGTVSAYDASLILQYVAGLITQFPSGNVLAKEAVAAGTMTWGKLVNGENVLALPLKVSGASNIFSVQFTANIGALQVETVKASLPKDWEISYKAADGKLTVAAAGITPISDGDIATINFKADKNQNSAIKVTSEVLLNENLSQSIEADVRAIPSQYALENNYPNPFNPSTTIKYALPQDNRVNVTVFNIQGQVVRTLVNADQTAGYYTIQWDGRNEAGSTVASGIYIYRINAGSFVTAKKMIMMK